MGRRTAPSAEGTERFRAKRDEVSVTCEAPRLRCGDASSRRKQDDASDNERASGNDSIAVAGTQVASAPRVSHAVFLSHTRGLCSYTAPLLCRKGKGASLLHVASYFKFSPAALP